ncbi:helix-hairpin-helix domain-containing protein [Mucilaginibacter sp. CSA2-8R]|uniref:helix-hairpin-helix domain-containing protein n=1 Tax=Mucilaginibacter sp. CSA2-8R TaxID=3141542 RepID=UPI00315D3383
MKPAIKNYFTLTKSDWNGLVILVLLIIAVMFAPQVYEYYHPPKAVNFYKLNQAVAQLKAAGVTGQGALDDEPDAPERPRKLFVFNPNHLSVQQWQKLGLSDGQIKGIKNYEAKGGRFYTKADVKKMYTLTPADYKQLAPYIQLPAGDTDPDAKPAMIVELNTVDSATLTQLKGVGPAFARRIIQYRNRLGGFHAKKQLKEVYGLDDTHYRDIQSQFTINRNKIKKLDVNAVEYEDLKNFPYLSYKQMNALIQYRKQHGNYETFDELHNVAILDDTTLRQVKPYFKIKK